MSKTASYPKVIALGTNPVKDIFDDDVEITEKIDGSQFGFGVIDGSLICRSKGLEQMLDAPDKMFEKAIEYVKSIQELLPAGMFFYGEYLQAPRHSTLAYERIPKNHICLFGVMNADKTFQDYQGITEWATKLNIDPVPQLFSGKSSPEHILELTETDSYLGGHKIEGVVVKRYMPWMFLNQIPLEVKAAKYVSEKFKEVNTRDWKKMNTGKGKLETLIDNYRTEARWEKAIQHLREAGELSETPADIGKLVKEVQRDVVDEEKENIKEALYKIFATDFAKRATAGLPEWYKQRLLLGADEKVSTAASSDLEPSETSQNAPNLNHIDRRKK